MARRIAQALPVPQLLLDVPGVTVPAGGTAVVAELTAFPIVSNGQMIQLSCWVGCVGPGDALATPNASNTILEQAFRVISNQLGAITANRIDKRSVGAAGTFAADVGFVLVGGSIVGAKQAINLVAQNTGAADLVGNVAVRSWWSPCTF